MQHGPVPLERPVADVQILQVALEHLEAVARAEPLEVLVPWQVEIDLVLYPECARCLVRPRARDVLHGISATAQEQQRNVLRPHVLRAARVTLHRQVQTAKFVSRERISATLEDDRGRSEDLKNLVNDLEPEMDT